MNGGVFGGQIGYNWQISSNWVFGFEADAQWTGQKGSGTFTCAATVIGGACLPGLTFLPPGVTGSALTISQELEWFGTVRARAGVLVTPEVLLYVTGGLAYGSIKTDTAFTVPTGVVTSVTALTSGSTIKAGWTVGGGLEAMFARDWSFKLEYLYVDLGSVSGATTAITIPPTFGITAAWDSKITDNILRAGINYRFSPGPVVARY
jgi:outer membrane immunogenic protein